MPIHVEVVSQERMLFSEPEADLIIIPGAEGQLGVLPHHTPLLTTMQYGELIIRKGSLEESFVIFGGVAEVRPDKVVILADAADFAADVNIEELEAARARAEQALASEGQREDREAMMEQLRRADLALQVSRKIRSRGNALGIRVVKENEAAN